MIRPPKRNIRCYQKVNISPGQTWNRQRMASRRAKLGFAEDVCAELATHIVGTENMCRSHACIYALTKLIERGEIVKL